MHESRTKSTVAKELKSTLETRGNKSSRQTGNIETHQQPNQCPLSVSIWEGTASITNFRLNL